MEDVVVKFLTVNRSGFMSSVDNGKPRVRPFRVHVRGKREVLLLQRHDMEATPARRRSSIYSGTREGSRDGGPERDESAGGLLNRRQTERSEGERGGSPGFAR